MTDPLKQPDKSQLIAAFADGELDGEANLRVLEQASADPAIAEQIKQHQQMRKACAKAMTSHETACPDALKQQIAAMAGDMSAAPSQASPVPQPAAVTHSERGPVLAVIGRWVPAAIAAMLLIAAWVVVSQGPGNDNPGPAITVASGASPLTAEKLNAFDKRHNSCGSKPQNLMEKELFPTQLDQLDDTLADMLTRDLSGASLDLSSLNYDYKVAGVCPVPGGNAVHILYKNPDDKSISLWIKPYDKDPVIEPDTPYLTQNGDHCPIVVWRQRDTVFFLVASSLQDIEKARPQIHLASAL